VKLAYYTHTKYLLALEAGGIIVIGHGPGEAWENRAGHAPPFPQNEGMSLEITEELIARQPPEAQAIIRALPEQRRLGIDESPTKEAGAKSWLWTFVASQAVRVNGY
jgi:hypothetical protein